MPLPLAWNLRKSPLRMADLLAFVAIVALWMTLGGPILDRRHKSRVEASVLVRVEPSFTAIKGLPSKTVDIDQFASDCGKYLRSPQAVQDVLGDTAISSLPSPPTKATVERCSGQKIQVGVIPGTFLMKCSLSVDEPARDTAILNAAAKAMLKGLPSPPGGLVQLISSATPPKLSASHNRFEFSAVFILFSLFWSLVTFALLRTFGISILHVIRPARAPS